MDRRSVLKGSAALAAFAAAGCVTRPAGSGAEASGPATREAAFCYAFPLYEFARTEQERTGALDGSPGRLNTVAHRAQLMDHTSRQVTAPNNDTIYSSAFLDLAGGPVEIVAPSSADRYFSVAFMDAFTDNFAYIGTRATKGKGGRYWVVGPQWQGKAPEGVNMIRSSTNDVWMLMRVLVDGPQDMQAAQAFQQQLSVAPAAGTTSPRPFKVKAADVNDPVVFLGLANEMLARSPGGKGQTARASSFAEFGVGPGITPSTDQLDAWRAYLPDGFAMLRETFRFRDLLVDGWSYQPPGVGDFGSNDKLRAAIALGGLAALGQEEAMYFHANFDASGSPLSGESSYRWRVPAGGVPVDAFWSLTMYRTMPDGRYFLVENPINRFSIGDRTSGLVTEPDGSFEILIQKNRPDGPLAANWLPAPEGPMRLALRAYLPKRPLTSRTWRVPALRKMET